MSRSIALLLLILPGVACLAPLVLASEDENPIFIAPDQSVPVSVQGSQSAAQEKKATPAAETPTAAEQKTQEEATPVAADQKAPAPVETAAAVKEPPPPQVAENEQKLHDMVKQAPRQSLKGRATLLMSAQLAALKAIERNLNVQIQGKQEDIVRLAIQEAKAVYDPVFTLSGSWSVHTQYNRFETSPTYQQATVKTPAAWDPVTGLPLDANGNPTSDPTKIVFIDVLDEANKAIPQFPMKRIVFTNPRPRGFPIKQNPASLANPNGPLQTNNGTLQVSQQLPWGPAVFITLASQKQTQFFDDGPNAAIDQQIQALNSVLSDPNASDADKQAARNKQVELQKLFKLSTLKFENYNKPWTSNAAIGALIPVPCTKDWGKYSPADVGLKLAKLGRDRSFYDTKNVINVTLVTVDHAYWDLVGTLENLRATSENRKLLAGMQSNFQKLLDAGRITQYGKFQIDSQLASVKQAEEQAWTVYTQASNALVNLLDLEDNTVLLPAGYTSNLAEQTKLSTGDAYTVAMENRSDLKAQQISGKSSEVSLKFARNQVKPNLKYSPNLSFSQNAAPYGFGSWEQSWAALWGIGNNNRHTINVSTVPGTPLTAFQLKPSNVQEETGSPDNRVHSHTLTYNWPFLNRSLKAGKTIAEANRDMQDITIQNTEKQVEEDVGDAVIGILSAKAQADLADQQYKLADTQYKQADQLLGVGRMTEFEIISRSADLLSADLNRIAAAIAYKKAESSLLYAEGVLPNTYAGVRANSELEGDRLEALAATKALRFFKPMPLPLTDSGSEAAAPGNEAKEQANGN